MLTQIMKVKLTWQTEEELRIPVCETEEETKQWIINRIKEFQIIHNLKADEAQIEILSTKPDGRIDNDDEFEY